MCVCVWLKPGCEGFIRCSGVRPSVYLFPPDCQQVLIRLLHQHHPAGSLLLWWCCSVPCWLCVLKPPLCTPAAHVSQHTRQTQTRLLQTSLPVSSSVVSASVSFPHSWNHLAEQRRRWKDWKRWQRQKGQWRRDLMRRNKWRGEEQWGRRRGSSLLTEKMTYVTPDTPTATDPPWWVHSLTHLHWNCETPGGKMSIFRM